jgi:hypothetical protein
MKVLDTWKLVASALLVVAIAAGIGIVIYWKTDSGMRESPILKAKLEFIEGAAGMYGQE